MAFAVRMVNYQSSKMLNICDVDLIGRTVRQSNLEVNISRNYFAERIVEEKEAESLLKNSSIINMAGKQTIDLSVRIGIGSLKGVKEIEGIPFLLVFKF